MSLNHSNLRHPAIKLVVAIAFVFLLWRDAARTMVRLDANIGYIFLNQATAVTNPEQTTLSIMQAERFLHRAFDLDSQLVSIRRGLGLAYGLQGKGDAFQNIKMSDLQAGEDALLIGHVSLRLGQNETAVHWFEIAVQYNPTLVEAWLALGEQYKTIGRGDLALVAYENAWKYESGRAFRPFVAELLNQNADQQAEVILRQALEYGLVSSDRAWGWQTLGQLLRTQERWSETNTVYTMALAEFPDDPSLVVNQGWAKYEQGAGAAIVREIFESVVQTYPENGAGYLALGQLMSREGNPHEADYWFAQALETDNANKRWYLLRAQTAVQAENYELAISVYEALLVQFPNEAEAYFRMAHIYQVTNAPKQAIAAIEQANILSGGHMVRYLLRAGEIYEWADNKVAAENAYEQALTIEPQNKLANERLAALNEN